MHFEPPSTAFEGETRVSGSRPRAKREQLHPGLQDPRVINEVNPGELEVVAKLGATSLEQAKQVEALPSSISQPQVCGRGRGGPRSSGDFCVAPLRGPQRSPLGPF